MKRAWLVSCIALSGAYSMPSRAWACTCSPAAIHSAEPADGAEGVPLNRALLVMGAFARDSISLRDAEGRPVPFALTAGPTAGCDGISAELVPEQPLRPNTEYVVSVDGIYPNADEGKNTLSFTTGTALLPDEEPQVPQGAASVLLNSPAPLCGSGSVRACVGVSDYRDVELIARRGERVLLHWLMGADAGEFALVEQPDCIELRRRTATGRRSAPLKICGDALQANPYLGDYPLSGRCHAGKFMDPSPPSGSVDGGLTHDAAASVASDGGGDGAVMQSAVDAAASAAIDAGVTPPPFSARVPQEGCSLEANPKSPPLTLLTLALSIAIGRRRRRVR
jgi:hypothetical protein